MRCDEIRERFVELLYSEADTPPASPELRAHVQSCPACRKELEGLKDVRIALRTWKDEAPIRPIELPKAAPKPSLFRFRPWVLAQYAAIAAVIVLAFLAGLHFNGRPVGSEYPTKQEVQELVRQAQQEVREIVRQAQYDSEARMSEATNLGLQKALETMESEQSYMYLHLTRSQVDRNRAKN